jgi:hypothetical protein
MLGPGCAREPGRRVTPRDRAPPAGSGTGFQTPAAVAYAGAMSPSAAASTAHPRPATGSAWLVVLVIGIVAGLVLITFAFSTNNTPASVDGTTATTSQFVDGS